MTTSATPKKRAARKAAPKTTAKVIELPAKRSRKATAKAPVTGESVVETHPLVGASITIEQVDQLGQLHELASAATEAFETYVVELLTAGASPSHVGKAVGMGNSSIRRIGWRHGWGAK
jgi:hypothetical protein